MRNPSFFSAQAAAQHDWLHSVHCFVSFQMQYFFFNPVSTRGLSRQSQQGDDTQMRGGCGSSA